jgi:magnesium transporter
MLVNCVVYEEGNKLADISVSQISEYLPLPGCFVWAALRDASEDELQEVQRQFGLHPLAVEDARHGHQRPKVEEYGSSLFAVMQLLEPDAQDGLALSVGEVFVGLNYVVSVRNRSERGFVEVRERCEREPELLKNGPGFVLYALMDAVVDRYFPIIDAFEVELETIEQRIFTKGAARARDNIRRLYELKQRLTVLNHAVAPLLEGAGKLHGGRVPQICVGSQAYFRDVVDHLGRINATIDSIRDTIGTAISVNFSTVTIEDGEVTKRLAGWAAIFAVCSSFASVWGMNFKHMPELDWRYGYLGALITIASFCGYLFYRSRRAGWV